MQSILEAYWDVIGRWLGGDWRTIGDQERVFLVTVIFSTKFYLETIKSHKNNICDQDEAFLITVNSFVSAKLGLETLELAKNYAWVGFYNFR